MTLLLSEKNISRGKCRDLFDIGLAGGQQRDAVGRLRRAFIFTQAIPGALTPKEFVEQHCKSRAIEISIIALHVSTDCISEGCCLRWHLRFAMMHSVGEQVSTET